jgi:hypothetical protein
MDISAKRAVSLWVPMIESCSAYHRLLVAAVSDRRSGC